ncbi:spore coat U domain-containing protein [Pseudomonas sp. NPDC086251]|uniref:Csu type fimbrial protein n=1 Tax=Pseudomonas sp. NPDC086251 TaxID=3364431 RepID=UPI0038387970
MQVLVARISASALALALAGSANALTTVTGQIDASLILTSSCLVNGASGGSGLNFGSLDFGTTDSLFTEAQGQVLGSGGGALSILCSAGTTPALKIRGGSHDGASAGGSRALANGGGQFVPYDLYKDTGHAQLVAIDDVIALLPSTGVVQTVNLYGKALGKPGLPAGTYSDTVAVELSF